MGNNFALLFMSSAFETGEENPHISPICLPQPGKKPFNDEYCVSHGWGKDEFGSGGKYQTRLKEVVVPIVRNNREPGIRQGSSHLVLDVERLASLLSMPMCPLLPAGLTDRFPSSMVRLKDPLTLDLPNKIVQNLVKNST